MENLTREDLQTIALCLGILQRQWSANSKDVEQLQQIIEKLKASAPTDQS